MYPALSLRLQALLPALSWLICLVVTAWLIAHWYWRFTAPESEYPHSPSATTAAEVTRELAQHNLFGIAAQTTVNAPIPSQQFKLMGMTQHFGPYPGFAILQPNDQSEAITAMVGEEFLPGTTLTAITDHTVEIQQGQNRYILTLDGMQPPGTSLSPVPETP